MKLWVGYFILFVLGYIAFGIFRWYALHKQLVAVPNERSSHTESTPTGAGIVFLIIWPMFVVILALVNHVQAEHLWLFFPPIAIISGMGYIDDHYHIAARYRFAVQAIAAIYILWLCGGMPTIDLGLHILHWSWIGALLAGIAIIWSTNLYNFMDGMDGLAGSEALFVFGFGGYFIWSANGHSLALIIWAIVALMAAFLIWNRPPAKIFMGDAGSTALGFLVAVFAILGERYYQVPALLWVILYSAFWFEATATLLRRVLHKEAWYEPHKLHSFQRLHRIGWSHAKVLIHMTLLNVVLAALAVLGYQHPRYVLVILLFSIIVLLVVYMQIERLSPMYMRRNAR